MANRKICALAVGGNYELRIITYYEYLFMVNESVVRRFKRIRDRISAAMVGKAGEHAERETAIEDFGEEPFHAPFRPLPCTV